MTTSVHETAQLGEVIAAAFDNAGHRSTDPWQVSWLAVQQIRRALRRSQLLEDEILANRWAEIVMDADL